MVHAEISRAGGRRLVAGLLVASAAWLGLAPAADADVILQFTQTDSQKGFKATNPTQGTTQLTTTSTANAYSVPIIVTVFDGKAADIPAYITYLNVHSVDAAAKVGSIIDQEFSGKVAITSGVNDTGTNYLTTTFTQADLTASNSAGSVFGSAPGDVGQSVSFTSDLLKLLPPTDDNPNSFSITYTGISPKVLLSNGTVAAFSANATGSFNASPVPEPSSLVSGGIAALAAAVAVYRRRKRARA